MKAPLTVLLLSGLVLQVTWAGVIEVPGGVFSMGCSRADPDCESDEGQPGGVEVDVPAFRLDSHEVTVAGYRACVSAGVCTAPREHSLNPYCNFGHQARDSHPVNCLDWQQAVDFCAWKGGRLPLEAEWEKAARAGSDSRFPWGQFVSCREAVLDEVSPGTSGREPDGCYTDATASVGSRQGNALGLHDMHGNAGEWTANWYLPEGLALYAAGQVAGPGRGLRRVVRGGSWDENRPNLRSSYRNAKPPWQGEAIYGSIGFRCAYDLPATSLK